MHYDERLVEFSLMRRSPAIHGEIVMQPESRKFGGAGRLGIVALLSFCIIVLTGLAAPAQSAKPAFDKNSPFYFDGTISRQALENYLDRSITMGYFLVPGQPERYQFPYRDD